MKQFKLDLKQIKKPPTITELWRAIHSESGFSLFKSRIEFFEWFKKREIDAFDKGFRAGERSGYDSGYRSGRNRSSSIPDNY